MEGEDYEKFIADSEKTLIAELGEFYVDRGDASNKWLFTYFVLALKMNRTVAATLLSTMCTPHNLMFQVRQWAYQSSFFFYYDDFETVLGLPSKQALKDFSRDLWNSVYAHSHDIEYTLKLGETWHFRFGIPSQSNAVFYLERKDPFRQDFRAGCLCDEEAAQTATEALPWYDFEIDNKEVSRCFFFEQLKAVFI